MRNESLTLPVDKTVYTSITNWSQEFSSQVLNGCRLFYVDPWSEMEIQVSLFVKSDPNSTTEYSSVDDVGMYYLFVLDEQKASREELHTIDERSFRVLPISTVSKFIIRSKVDGVHRSNERNPLAVDPETVASSFKAAFKDLKLDPVNYIIAHARAYSGCYKFDGKFYAPISCLCQCSGSGKSKSCTTATKRTPGFYVCFREAVSRSFSFPPANSVSASFLEIFDHTYTVDTLENQLYIDCETSNVGKCLLFVASCIKSYYVAIALKFALSIHNKPENISDHDWLLKQLADFAAKYFESAIDSPDYFRFHWTKMVNDVCNFTIAQRKLSVTSTDTETGSEPIHDASNPAAADLHHSASEPIPAALKSTSEPNAASSSGTQPTDSILSSNSATVSQVGEYILKILESPYDCFIHDETIIQDSIKDKDNQANFSNAVKRGCHAISNIIKGGNPFLFFIDEAGILARKGGYEIKHANGGIAGKFSAFQIFRRAISYLPTAASIHFVALGTKSSIEELSPPIVDNSSRGNERVDFLPPIIFTQNSDMWREEYPLNELVPCFRQLSNCCFFKFLVSLGHPLCSSVGFQHVISVLRDKLLNGTSQSTKIFLIAIWMIRAGLSCDPRSVLAGSLVEEHMATLFNIRSANPSSSKVGNSTPTFARESCSAYDITYPSNPCLGLATRLATAKNLDDKADFLEFWKANLIP